MASFPPVTMTTEGLNMIAKASSGNTEDRLIITKVKLKETVYLKVTFKIIQML